MAERDAVKRLHMLCDWLEKQMDESPYDSDSWDELQENNAYLQTKVAELKKENATLRTHFGERVTRIESQGKDMRLIINQVAAFLNERGINDVPSEIVEGINKHLSFPF